MSQYPLHAICWPCWRERFDTTPDEKPATLLGPLVRCCFCGYGTNSRLYVESTLPELTCDHETTARETQP